MKWTVRHTVNGESNEKNVRVALIGLHNQPVCTAIATWNSKQQWFAGTSTLGSTEISRDKNLRNFFYHILSVPVPQCHGHRASAIASRCDNRSTEREHEKCHFESESKSNAEHPFFHFFFFLLRNSEFSYRKCAKFQFVFCIRVHLRCQLRCDWRSDDKKAAEQLQRRKKKNEKTNELENRNCVLSF